MSESTAERPGLCSLSRTHARTHTHSHRHRHRHRHTHTHTYRHAHTDTDTDTDTYRHAHTLTLTDTQTHIQARTHSTLKHTHTHTQTGARTHTHTCKDRQSRTHTQRKTDRKTDLHAHTHTNLHTHTLRHTHPRKHTHPHTQTNTHTNRGRNPGLLCIVSSASLVLCGFLKSSILVAVKPSKCFKYLHPTVVRRRPITTEPRRPLPCDYTPTVAAEFRGSQRDCPLLYMRIAARRCQTQPGCFGGTAACDHRGAPITEGPNHRGARPQRGPITEGPDRSGSAR